MRKLVVTLLCFHLWVLYEVNSSTSSPTGCTGELFQTNSSTEYCGAMNGGYYCIDYSGCYPESTESSCLDYNSDTNSFECRNADCPGSMSLIGETWTCTQEDCKTEIVYDLQVGEFVCNYYNSGACFNDYLQYRWGTKEWYCSLPVTWWDLYGFQVILGVFVLLVIGIIFSIFLCIRNSKRAALKKRQEEQSNMTQKPFYPQMTV